MKTPGAVTTNLQQMIPNHPVGNGAYGEGPKNVRRECARPSRTTCPIYVLRRVCVRRRIQGKNPTLTNIALSWRTSDGIVENFGEKAGIPRDRPAAVDPNFRQRGSWAGAGRAPGSPVGDSKFFTTAEQRTVERLCELLIPTDAWARERRKREWPGISTWCCNIRRRLFQGVARTGSARWIGQLIQVGRGATRLRRGRTGEVDGSDGGRRARPC